MRNFKQLDFWLNTVLIPGSIVAGCIQNDFWFYGYFIVGGWQLISMSVHTWQRWFTTDPGRRNYHRLVLIVLIAALTGAIWKTVLFILAVLLLFSAPLMAVYYSWICYTEVYVKMQRPLALLK